MAAGRTMFLSVEELWRLANAVRPVEDAFGGENAWLVGSVLERADWRDVDIRIIIDDEHYRRLFRPLVNDVDGTAVGVLDQFRMLIQTAISAMLRESTHLPVDFQIQSQTEANQYEGKRNPLTLRPYINPDFQPQWMRANRS